MTQSAPLPDPVDAAKTKTLVTRVVFVMAFAVLLYVGAAFAAGHERLAASLRAFPVGTHLPMVLGLVLSGLILRAFRWHYYVRKLGWPVPTHESFLVFFASFAFTATPGKAGEVVKSGLLNTRRGVPIADSAGVLLVERLGDLVAVLLLAIGGLSMLANSWIYFTICLGSVLALILFVTVEPLFRPLLRALGRFRKGEAIAKKVETLLATGKSLLRPVPFIVGLAIAVVAWSCEALAFHLILGGFGHPLPMLTAFSIYGISTVVGALSMLPGGVGGVEGAMALMLTGTGLKTAETLGPIVLIRATTLWFGSLAGFVFLGIWFAMTSPKRKVSEVPS